MNTLKFDQVKALYFGQIYEIFAAILNKAANVGKTESQLKRNQKTNDEEQKNRRLDNRKETTIQKTENRLQEKRESDCE